MQGLCGQLTQIFRDRVQAEELFVAFCKVEKLVFSLAEASSGKSGNIKVCRCGCINDVSDGRKVCSSCGLELVIKCPKVRRRKRCQHQRVQMRVPL